MVSGYLEKSLSPDPCTLLLIQTNDPKLQSVKADVFAGMKVEGQELGRKYHMGPRAAKRYAESVQNPAYTLSGSKCTKIDSYNQMVDEWLEEAPYSAVRILEELREMEIDGRDSIVEAYVSSQKMDLSEKAAVWFETMPGKQGDGLGLFEDRLVYEDGKWKKLSRVLMILGHSRMQYIEFVTDMSTNTPIWRHQNAFQYFGGCLISYAANQYSVPPEYVGKDVAVVALDSMLVHITRGSRLLCRASYQRKDMVVNSQHDRRLTRKQTMDAENVLLEQDKVIDFSLNPFDLSRYDKMLYN